MSYASKQREKQRKRDRPYRNVPTQELLRMLEQLPTEEAIGVVGLLNEAKGDTDDGRRIPPLATDSSQREPLGAEYESEAGAPAPVLTD